MADGSGPIEKRQLAIIRLLVSDLFTRTKRRPVLGTTTGIDMPFVAALICEIDRYLAVATKLMGMTS